MRPQAPLTHDRSYHMPSAVALHRHLARGTRSRIGLTLWACAAFLLLASAPPLHAADSVPDWVKAAVQQSPAKFPERAKAAVLLDETTYTVGSDGRATEHVRRVVKILRPQGREEGYPVVWFDKDSKVLSMHVWSIDPAGHEYALKDNEIVDFRPPGERRLLLRCKGQGRQSSRPRPRRHRRLGV